MYSSIDAITRLSINFENDCTTHVQRLKCDLKLDSMSKIVKITGVGRMYGEKTVFRGLLELSSSSMSFYPKKEMIHSNNK